MNKFWTTARFTFTKHAKTKSYVATTIIASLFIVFMLNIDLVISLFNDDAPETVAVQTDSDELYGDVKQALNDIDAAMTLERFAGSTDEAKAAVQDGTYSGFLQMDIAEGLPQASYLQKEQTSSPTAESLNQALQQVKESYALNEAGLNEEILEAIKAPVAFERNWMEQPAQTGEEMFQARALVYVLIFVIYFSVIMYGNMIATEVATEKSSRVMEILISSVSPVTQMFAKIIGIALLGLMQFAIIGSIAFASMQLRSAGSEEESVVMDLLGLNEVPVDTLLYLLLFFLLGYLFYATLAAMLGSLVSSLEEVNQAVAPVNYVLILAFFIAMSGLSAPEEPLVTIASFIPPFTPVIMFLRVGLLDVPLIEVLLGIGLLVASIIALAFFGGRVYRGGVLMYSGRSGIFKDIKKALRMNRS
ncbi:ABC transporter permease [Bacillaceae bacterium SIJ1]|uniref:ABC transporter permease n=1 Tax=Litoribacterium kuwaitense TaxID=1398745 RepID=UPI0013ED17B5|nr:ABC transporter permease [Litoribacterium kuwaitense]NGP45914.1 ABC transporter permease [Litoribacterium kuwaitense]